MSEEMRILRIVRRRRVREADAGRVFRPAGRILLAAVNLICAAAAGILLYPLPPPEPELNLGNRPQAARFYDRTGRLLAEAGSASATMSRWYALDEAAADDCVLPAFLAARGIAAEEIRGTVFAAGLRAMAGALAGVDGLAGEAAGELLSMEGASGGIWRKSRLAGALALRYTPSALAEWIINVRLYGRGAVGIDDAALTYFGVRADGMSPAQCAALEALAEDPRRGEDPAGWKIARNSVLNRMFNGGFLGSAEWERAVAGEIGAREADGAATDPIFGGRLPILDSFLELAVDRLGGRFPPEELPRAAIRVFTTMDAAFEMQVLCAAQNLLAPADGASGPRTTLEGNPCDLAALLGPAGAGDLPEDLALAVIDPASGELLAYFDSARGNGSAARGPAGSSVLPFVYLSAFARGFSPGSMLLDIPRPDFPEEESREYLGPVSARTALQRRALAAADGMVAAAGADQAARTLSLLGVSTETTADPSLQLWRQQEADLLDLTQAYATLAGGGLETADAGSGTAAVILRVERSDGAQLEEYSRRQTRKIFGSDLAFLVQDILTDPSGRADLSAPALAGSRSAVAAMPAEGLQGEGAWAFAASSGLAVGVRGRAYPAGRTDPRSPWMLAQAAAGWALRAMPMQVWTEPPGIVRRDVCVPTGLLPSRYCPNVASELFLTGNEPIQTDTYYRPVAVNRESGRLATLWTPLDLVEEKVFFITEGEARIWAERSGFPIPPDTYDALPHSFPYYEGLHIASPSPLASLRGMISLKGTADAAGMERYLLQAGPGLYPSVWYTLGSGERPVRGGTLGEWNAAGAEGIWSIQLTAVFEGGITLSVAIPVILDNTPPVLRWIQPTVPKTISLLRGEALILQVEAADNLEVERVDFYLDGAVRTRLEVGPYSVRWRDLSSGTHKVKVCGKDRSGNETCTQEIEVKVGLKPDGGSL
ncbi:MAG: transglycosylase domain-containing protein [Anaerolineales bacterium]|nr:transglycosylase domain-containing protein [Anaerolineales bacterium]